MLTGTPRKRSSEDRTTRVAALLALICLLAPADAGAQDTNYWTAKYGTRAILLAGAVIGAPVDLSATFYNPGGVALGLEQEFFLTSKTFQFANIKVKNVAGEGLDFTSQQVGIIPSFVGGFLPNKWLGEKNKLAYSLLQRFESRFEVETRTITSLDSIPSLGTGVDFFGEAALDSRLTETWGGVSWSRKYGERLGLGATLYGAYRYERGRSQILAEGLTSADTGAVIVDINAFKYWNFRFLWKIGAMYTLEDFSFGVALTTPGLDLFGTGSAGFNQFVLAPESPTDTIVNRFVAVEREGSSTYRSPLSIGAGMEYEFNHTRVFGSAEWYNSVGPYNILELGPFVGQTTGDTIQVKLVQELKAVVAWAVGMRQKLSEKVSGYLSFAFDPATVPENPDSPDATTVGNWDIRTITAGATFPLGSSEFTLGLGFGWGGGTAEQLVDFGNVSGGGILPGAVPTPIDYTSIRFTIGFSI
jgi:hypothetical protein